jgi:hypothetical protein
VKNQYVADVNDFLKYGLLRAVTGPDLQLAVIWMLTPGDGRTDGRRLAYLGAPERFRAMDPSLFDALKRIVESGDRKVRAIEAARVLTGAVFFSDVLEDGLQARRSYFEQTWAVAGQLPLVFFDPDNGLEIGSVSKGKRNSAKYLYWDELQDAYARGHSLVVYQHFPRRARLAFLRTLSQRARDLLECQRVFAVATAHVAFLMFPQEAHEAVVSQRLREFASRAAPHATAIDFTSSGL